MFNVFLYKLAYNKYTCKVIEGQDIEMTSLAIGLGCIRL